MWHDEYDFGLSLMLKGKKNEESFTVTPWTVKGKINYDRLIEEFGTQSIKDPLLKKIEKYTGPLHPLLRRKIFFSHRDLDLILKQYELGHEFFLYTGRGPSGHTHLGHLVPWMLTQHLQEKFGVDLYFMMTDDEKFMHDSKLGLHEAIRYSHDNALDVLACGFDPKKTFIFSDIEYAKTLYKIAVQVAKHVTNSTVKAVFGFKSSTNIGMLFFPAMQAVPCFLPSVLTGKKLNCLIPAAIDQDNYWRGIAREVAPKIGYPKPAQIHSKFMPGLGQGGKMSASEPESAIFTIDSPEEASNKVMISFTGGRSTVQEQREKGGEPDICPIYQYYYFLMENDDDKIKKIYEDCKSGSLLCGDCKANLAGKVKKFLVEHQKKREKAKSYVDSVFLKD